MDVSQPVLVATASAHTAKALATQSSGEVATISALYAATVPPPREAFGE